MPVFLSLYQQISININGSVIKSSNCEKLLGIISDSNITFEGHINTLYRKASLKLMPYLEFRNIYHNIKSNFYSKLL